MTGRQIVNKSSLESQTDEQTVGFSNLWIYTLSTGDFKPIVDLIEPHGFQYPEWSPDGKFIMEMDYHHYSGSPVAIIDIATKSFKVSDFNGWCSLSSDGQRMICIEPSFEGCEINPLEFE